jgi:hypothetical protein
MAKEQVEVQRTTTREGEIEKVELEIEKRDIRANLLAARKKQLLRRKRGYGKLPGSLRR